MPSAFIPSTRDYPAVRLAPQLEHQRCVPPSPLVLGRKPLKFPPPTADRDRPVSRRSEPSSRTTFIGEQPNPWELLHPQDVMSRHRTRSMLSHGVDYIIILRRAVAGSLHSLGRNRKSRRIASARTFDGSERTQFLLRVEFASEASPFGSVVTGSSRTIDTRRLPTCRPAEAVWRVFRAA